MVKKNYLEEIAKDFIALKELRSPVNIISERCRRKYEEIGKEIGDIMKKGKSLPEYSKIYITLKWDDKASNSARQISLALKEFEQVNPSAYKQLIEIKEKHKIVRRAYLEFGGEVESEVYVNLIKELIDTDDEKALEVYNDILFFDNLLKRKKEKEYDTFLLP